jgi:NAD(P)-dependent dehydrogenase (short-subunit alcohol dehydrogenase family)
MLLDLTGRTILITGAGRGLGRACAIAAAGAGADVIAVARTESDLLSLAAEKPGRIQAWAMDATGGVFFERIETLEALDGLVNNAGFNRPQPFLDVDEATLDSMLALNVRAAFRTAQSAARVMVRSGRGAIVNMSSQMGHVGSPRRSVYCLTKHAIEGLTKAMAVELAPMGLRVNSVAPTFIDTPMTRPMLADKAFRSFVFDRIPLGRLGYPEEVAAAVIFLLSDRSSLITGTSLLADGGWTAQ